MKPLKISPIIFSDNYIWSIELNNHSVLVDPGNANVSLNYLKSKNLALAGILITHHHYDHIEGLKACLEIYPETPVYGPDNPKIEGISHFVEDGDFFTLFAEEIVCKTIATPGHTLDHTSFWLDNQYIFTGDCLFSGGCGRIFEGSPESMLHSIEKILALPDDTLLYCGHEYTLNNLSFAKSILPENAEIDTRLKEVKTLIDADKPSVPNLISDEKKSNIFCRFNDSSLQRNLSKLYQKELTNRLEIFTALRKLKDSY